MKKVKNCVFACVLIGAKHLTLILFYCILFLSFAMIVVVHLLDYLLSGGRPSVPWAHFILSKLLVHLYARKLSPYYCHALPAKLNSPTKWCRRHASNWLQDSWISRRFMQILSLLKVHSLQLQVFDLKWPTKRENIERIRTEIFFDNILRENANFYWIREERKWGKWKFVPDNPKPFVFRLSVGFLSMALLTRFEVKLKLNWKNNSVFV